MKKTKYRKLKPKYSGKKSYQFWNAVNSDKKHQAELFSLGCILQNVEGFVLKRINEYKEYKQNAERK